MKKIRQSKIEPLDIFEKNFQKAYTKDLDDANWKKYTITDFDIIEQCMVDYAQLKTKKITEQNKYLKRICTCLFITVILLLIAVNTQ